MKAKMIKPEDAVNFRQYLAFGGRLVYESKLNSSQYNVMAHVVALKGRFNVVNADYYVPCVENPLYLLEIHDVVNRLEVEE